MVRVRAWIIRTQCIVLTMCYGVISSCKDHTYALSACNIVNQLF